jgi:rhodanese-related sulfurtransferase
MVPEITGEELRVKMMRGEDFVLLDVRGTPDYEKERLPMAEHMLITDMNKNTLRRFDKEKPIITYSVDIDCPASRIAAEKLEMAGFSTLNYQASFKDWVEKGYPTEKDHLNNPQNPGK